MPHVVGFKIQPVFKWLCLARLLFFFNHYRRMNVTICPLALCNGRNHGIHHHIQLFIFCDRIHACYRFEQLVKIAVVKGRAYMRTRILSGSNFHGGTTGGGYSNVFPRPEWQAAVVTQSGRGVPDVAANADPETGYNVLVDGHQEVAGGTSAAAPLWAGLIALLNQKLNRRLEFVNPFLYSIDQTSGFRDINLGNNGAYTATYGWDPCTGNGTPMGAQLLQALQQGAPLAPWPGGRRAS